MLKKIKSTADYLKRKIDDSPEFGIILGTGLGGLVSEIEIKHDFPYETIPDFPVSTVDGHHGRLIFGNLAGKRVVAMQGRFHLYEGYSMNHVVYPVRVMKYLGIKRLFLSNASGGVNPDFEIGDIMIQTDHINLFPTNPLMGQNEKELGPRFPDMSEPYDYDMIAKAKEIAAKNNIKVQEGTYLGMSGPCLETPAEYRMVRILGADAVGMSTVPEVIAARHMGIPCFAISIITDLGVPGKIVKVTHQDVQSVAERSQPMMTLVMKELIQAL